MKREKKYNKKKFQQLKFRLVIRMFELLLVIITVGTFLNYHLFNIQKIERLNKIRDYTEYKIKLDFLDANTKPQEKLIYEDSDIRFYLSGVKEANIYYGSTSTTLENALKKEYLTLEILQESLFKETNNGFVKYTFKGSNDPHEQYAIYEFTRLNDKTDYYFTTL